MKRVILNSILISFLFFVTSCTKEGPQGPQGPAGKDGNANVKTMEITVYSYEWEEVSDDGYSVDKTCSIITDDIVKNGSINVFLEVYEDTWLALPYKNLVYAYSTGTLTLIMEGEPSSNYKFKIVAIAGNNVDKQEKTNFSSYDEIKDYYQLKN